VTDRQTDRPRLRRNVKKNKRNRLCSKRESTVHLIRPPGTPADRRENLTRNWKYVDLDNVGFEIGGLPQNNFRGNCFVCNWARHLRAPSTDRCETLPNEGK